MEYAHVEAGIVDRIILADSGFIATLPDAAEWYAAPYGIGIGWAYAAGVWTGPNGESPPTPPTEAPNYLLTGTEWVLRFTDAEWRWLKDQRALTTNAGKQLDRFMDAIRWTNSIDVSSPTVDVFYNWLLANGIPGGQARIDVLRAPV